MTTDKCPDIFGMCETFLERSIPDCQLVIDGFNLLRKDRSDTQNKSGGGLVLYYRKSLSCRRRIDLEISKIETLWTEFTPPNAKPFLVCTAYRPPNAQSEWIELFETELSIAQTTGFEIILMGDFNIDYKSCPNKKLLNMIQLFDLSQLVTEPTRITETTATTIDHVYSSHPENITECFISHFTISDHFPVCFTRKTNFKVIKNDHRTTSYRCFKKFDDILFLNDLQNDLNSFSANSSDVEEDFSESIINTKDSKFIWKHLRSINSPTTNSSKTLPDELIINGQKITNSENVAAKLNDYFSSITDILNENSDESPNFEKLQRLTDNKIPEGTLFHIPPITCDQVVSFISRFDASKATGIDGLGPRIIKLAAHVIAPSITKLINRSIITGIFPSQLKLAKVFPIYKGETKSDPSNYRPISILPTISKIFEKHINHHLMGYLNKYKLIHESQSGFGQKHSCQTALVNLIDHWTACIDKGDIIGTLFVDFRKAFDVVDHSILINKLHLYKFSPNAVRWFQSYLSCRQQAIVCDVGLTDFVKIRSGVPQGSILGPILFLLFINDLPLFLKYCNSDFYADDATFHTNGKDKLTIENNLQSDLSEAKQWSKCNKMYINYQKTSCMTLGTKHRLNGSKLDINADNIKIKQVSDQKLLGLHIDENLNWCSHIDHLCKTVSSKISLLRQLSEYVPAHVQRLFYQGYILPLLDYGSVIWGSSSTANIERLTKLQKRAARIILNAEFDTSPLACFRNLTGSLWGVESNTIKQCLPIKH